MMIATTAYSHSVCVISLPPLLEPALDLSIQHAVIVQIEPDELGEQFLERQELVWPYA